MKKLLIVATITSSVALIIKKKKKQSVIIDFTFDNYQELQDLIEVTSDAAEYFNNSLNDLNNFEPKFSMNEKR